MSTVGGNDWNMVGALKTFVFSLVLSAVSLLAVVMVPITVTEPVATPGSPYENDIQRLRGKGYLLFEEKEDLDELVEKHNRYLLVEAQSNLGDHQNALSKKSTIVSPLIGLLWLLSYRAFLNRSPRVVRMQLFVVLSVPLLLAVIGAMSVVEVLLISVVVLAVAMWRQVSAARSNN